MEALAGRREILAVAGRTLSGGGRVVLTGPPGVGTSTVLRALGAASGGPVTAVATGPGADEPPYALVAEIVRALPPRALPGAQRAAVDAVLRRTGGPPDALAVRFALTALLDGGPALLTIDDGHRADAASLAALAYALPRAGTACAVAGRPGTETLLPDARHLPVPPLSCQDVAELLGAHGLPCHLAGRVHAATGGRPGWALAIAADDDRTLDGLVAAGLAALPEAARAALLTAALARRPTVALLERAGHADAALGPAADAGLIVVDAAGTVRFTGTAISAFVVRAAGWSRRTATHRRLAECGGAVDRAFHRAHGAPSPAVAAELAGAAATARASGDLLDAAELGLLAAERTADPALAVSAAEDAAGAGRPDLVARAGALLDRVGGPADRARAGLAALRATGQGIGRRPGTGTLALADAGGDVALQAEVRLRLAIRANVTGGAPDLARREAGDAVRLAERAADPELLARALTMRARTERLLGHPGAARTLARALTLCPIGPGPLNDSALFLAVRHAVFDDRLDAAAALLARLRVRRAASAEDAVDLLRTRAEIDARAGRCDRALAHARRAVALTESAGLSPGPAWFTLAAAEVAGGTWDDARLLATHAARASREEHDLIFLARSLHVLGTVALVSGDPAAALAPLERVAELEEAAGVADPSQLRWHADLIAAYAATGRERRGRDLTARTRTAARRRPGVLAALDRADAALHAAAGDLAAAETALRSSADAFSGLGLPVERGRSLLALARVLRRRRRRAPARDVLAEASEVFTAARARPWTRQVRLEAARLDPARGGDLTAGEERVAELAAGGATNKEIAATLNMSVKTVEAALTRIYRKLGVRSRTQLAVNGRPGTRDSSLFPREG
ncbi:helix-turn-helix transcriptional regulator [Actinomadura flavalba]|uniref:helix-turn-helix transcriptional regulator n=1 Tax=Actinomadura flavalba TaxID=1120938 RepID=UPI00037521E1|nr:LuxR family transcriptional regulator [Actinomadura flavalba]